MAGVFPKREEKSHCRAGYSSNTCRGRCLRNTFPAFITDKQEYLLGEIADILKHIRAFKLPDSINGFGGLTFDVDGREVVNKAPVTSEGVAGPCETYGDLYSSYLQRQLQLVDQCPLVEDDWMNEELRERMDGFAREGLEPLIKSKTKPRQTLVHGNFGQLSSNPSIPSPHS